MNVSILEAIKNFDGNFVEIPERFNHPPMLGEIPKGPLLYEEKVLYTLFARKYIECQQFAAAILGIPFQSMSQKNMACLNERLYSQISETQSRDLYQMRSECNSFFDAFCEQVSLRTGKLHLFIVRPGFNLAIVPQDFLSKFLSKTLNESAIRN